MGVKVWLALSPLNRRTSFAADWTPLGNPAYAPNLPIMTIFTHDSCPVETELYQAHTSYTEAYVIQFCAVLLKGNALSDLKADL
ncbi:hypothetical protein GRJ2_001887700 [Grus japonensis]|uniref:Uncharacterized protein n=1 Tax=Grus japonensis TaxID=30415 RepID=A0ABC9X9J8_GRUJA